MFYTDDFLAQRLFRRFKRSARPELLVRLFRYQHNTFISIKFSANRLRKNIYILLYRLDGSAQYTSMSR